MNKNLFFKLCEEKITSFSNSKIIVEIQTNSDSWGDDITFFFNYIAVNIRYEPRDSYIHTLICRLKNKKIINDPVIIKKDSVLNNFSLDDIVNIKKNENENERYIVDPNDEISVSKVIELIVNDLKKYAQDVLNGDFTIFTELDKIVKSRIDDDE